MGLFPFKPYLRDLCVTISNLFALCFYGDSQLIEYSSASALTASYGTTRSYCDTSLLLPCTVWESIASTMSDEEL